MIMKYSIIVPIYKVESYLEECINSVLNQTYSDFELILVDDGSPDNCPKICDNYASFDNRIIVVHKENGGLVSARKAGLEVASGHYIICLDGDDKIDNRCIEVLDKYLNEYNPDVLCFGHKIYSKNKVLEDCYVKGHEFGFYNRNKIEREILSKLLYEEHNKRNLNIWGKVYKTDLYKQYQMKVDSRITMGEDSACVYPLIANAQSMMIISECLYYYRVNPTSMTKTKQVYSWKVFELIYDLYEKEVELDKLNQRMQFCQSRVHNLFIVACSRFYQEKKYIEIKQDINEELKKTKNAMCIEKACFNSLLMKMVRISLKYRLYSLILLYSKFRLLTKY